MTIAEAPPEPGIAIPEKLTVNQAISAVMSEIGAVAKNRQNVSQNYKFRGIDDFLNAAHPVLVKHGLTIVPRDMNHTLHVRERQTEGGRAGVTIHVILQVRSEIEGPAGDKKFVTTVGEAADTADKATNKAMSAAEKYMLISVFKIPTEDLSEGDNDHPDMGTTSGGRATPPPPPTPPKPPTTDPNKPTKPMMDKMAILCNEIFGKEHVKEIKAVLKTITKRVDSRAQMTKGEAHKVIDTLTQIQSGKLAWIMNADGTTASLYEAGTEPFETGHGPHLDQAVADRPLQDSPTDKDGDYPSDE